MTHLECIAEIWVQMVVAADGGDHEARVFLATLAPYVRELLCEQLH